MSIWDSVKPAKKTLSATAVVLSKDKRSLQLTWTDGTTTQASARSLRQACPCAGCVEEWTGRRTLEPESVPEDISVAQVESVGNYALLFHFSDAHHTGIYQWEYLRSLSR